METGCTVYAYSLNHKSFVVCGPLVKPHQSVVIVCLSRYVTMKASNHTSTRFFLPRECVHIIMRPSLWCCIKRCTLSVRPSVRREPQTVWKKERRRKCGNITLDNSRAANLRSKINVTGDENEKKIWFCAHFRQKWIDLR